MTGSWTVHARVASHFFLSPHHTAIDRLFYRWIVSVGVKWCVAFASYSYSSGGGLAYWIPIVGNWVVSGKQGRLTSDPETLRPLKSMGRWKWERARQIKKDSGWSPMESAWFILLSLLMLSYVTSHHSSVGVVCMLAAQRPVQSKQQFNALLFVCASWN